MEKAIVVYGSTTGNTEQMASWITEMLAGLDYVVAMKNVTDASPGELADYDLILLGSSTWGEGELQEDFEPFYEQMDDIGLKGKKAAVFGPGDSSYELFCKAVDMLEEKLSELEAEVVVEGLKVDGDVGLVKDEIRDWAKEVGEEAGGKQ
jgi:flavodoxin I